MWSCVYMYIYIYICYHQNTAEKIQMLSDVKEHVFGNMVAFQNDIKPSFNHTIFLSKHQIPTYFAVYCMCIVFYCSVWLTCSIAVEKCNGRCTLLHSWKKVLFKEHAAYMLQSALKIFPWVRSSILKEKYNRWKNAIQPSIKLSPPIMFLTWHVFSGKT